MTMLEEMHTSEHEENSDISAEEEEEEEEDGSGDSVIESFEQEENQASKRKHEEEGNETQKKKKKVSLDKVHTPTVKELNELRETANLFHSNLFRLQIEEMLKEMQIKTKYHKLFEEWFEKLKTFLLSLPEREEQKLSKKSSKDFKVKAPVTFTPENAEGSFKFIHPEDLTIGGSYKLQACVGPTITIDVHVHMPPQCFQRTDHLNFQFVRKRALYLTVLAEALKDNELVADTNYIRTQGSPLRPLLEVQPSGKLGKRIRVMLWPVTSPDAVQLPKLRPKRGNIHSRWFLRTQVPKEGEQPEPPSAHYNSEIVQDAVWRQNHEMLLADLSAPSLRDGLILLKVWLRQRKLDQGYGCFSGFILAMYLVYLVQRKRLNAMMSSYQVARITWNALANSNWMEEGVSLSTAAAGPPLSVFHELFDVVFVDASGMCNICAGVNKEIYFLVREESAQAVRFLDTAGLNSFQALFMTPVTFEQSCDHIIRFHESSALKRVLASYSTPELRLTHAGYSLPQLLHMVIKVLRLGLHQRVKTIRLLPSAPQRWSCMTKPLSCTDITTPLILGLTLNHQHAFSKIEKGPPANTPEAKEFSEFWGKQSQLRRFLDGGIHEAVLWDGAGSVCEQIVQYLLKKYVGLDSGSYIYMADTAKQVLKLPEERAKDLQGEEATRDVIASFDALTKELRALRGLPLAVNTIQGISPVFRYCDVYPSRWSKKFEGEGSRRASCILFKMNKLKPVQRYCPVYEGVMTLEHSSKWPQDLEAVKRLKAAVCIQMASLLAKQFFLHTQAYPGYFDVYKTGFVFRIWLGYLREVALLKELKNPDGSIAYHDTPESRALEEKIELLPQLSSALHGLQQQFPGFSPTARLAKRWLSSQMLGPPHIPDMVVELLVAHLFLSPEPFVPAVQGELGLLRFLTFVSTTNWHTTPLLLNLNGEFSMENITELETQFNSKRPTLPFLFLATPYDRTPSQWTRGAPTLQILLRLAAVASEALKFLRSQLLESLQPDILPAFRPSLTVYDAVIFLEEEALSRHHEAQYVQIRERRKALPRKKGEPKRGQLIPIVNFDPVQKYLALLREGYDHCALFFHDQYGGSAIGVVWKPSAFQERDFKVSTVNCCKPVRKGIVCVNKEALLEDFLILGSNLVKFVDSKTQKADQQVDDAA